MSEWISAKDKLPDDEVTVLCKQVNSKNLMLCYVECGLWKEDYQDICVGGDGFIDNKICCAADEKHYLRITHWMPLPAPPK